MSESRMRNRETDGEQHPPNTQAIIPIGLYYITSSEGGENQGSLSQVKNVSLGCLGCFC